jgi:hypothetical protein
MIYFRSLPFRRQRLYYSITAIVLLSLVFGIISFEFADEREFVITDNPAVSGPPSGKISITVNLANRLLEVYNDEKLFKKYRIAVGKSGTPSPIGEWYVVWKDYNWGTGFGTRWMGLNVPWGIYGIHGTNKPWSIGQFASHGCIRMRNKDVEELFEWIPVGTPVKIEGRKVKIQRVLKYQTTGADVVVLQIRLREMGYLQERADGIYGKATEEAVRKYQQEKGLEVNGVVNKSVLETLGV